MGVSEISGNKIYEKKFQAGLAASQAGGLATKPQSPKANGGTAAVKKLVVKKKNSTFFTFEFANYAQILRLFL